MPKCERAQLFRSFLPLIFKFMRLNLLLGQSSILQNVQIGPTIPKSDSIFGTTFYHFTFALLPRLSHHTYTRSAYFANTNLLGTYQVRLQPQRTAHPDADTQGWRDIKSGAGEKQGCLGKSGLAGHQDRILLFLPPTRRVCRGRTAIYCWCGSSTTQGKK